MKHRNFIAFAMSMFLICISATVFVACEEKNDKDKLIYGDIHNPKQEDYVDSQSLMTDIDTSVSLKLTFYAENSNDENVTLACKFKLGDKPDMHKFTRANILGSVSDEQLDQLNARLDTECGLYYYGLSSVSVAVNELTQPLEIALANGNVTIADILGTCQQLPDSKIISILGYDGGSCTIYNFDFFKIIDYNGYGDDRSVNDIYICKSNLLQDFYQNLYKASSLCGLPLADSQGDEVTATVLKVTDTSIKFKLDTELSDIYTGEPYYIERKEDGEWQKVPTTVAEEDIAWIMPAYSIPGEFTQDWSYLYGQLPAGNYRLNKNISGSDIVNNVYVYFTVPTKHSAAKIFGADISVQNQITDYTKGEENQVTVDISAEDAAAISRLLLDADWTAFEYTYDDMQNNSGNLNYYHIWADGFVVDYNKDEGEFEAVDFSKTSMFSSKFPTDRLRLVLTEAQKEIVDGIIENYFTQPVRTNCY